MTQDSMNQSLPLRPGLDQIKMYFTIYYEEVSLEIIGEMFMMNGRQARFEDLIMNDE